MGTTSLGGEIGGLDWQQELCWALPHHFPFSSPPPWILLTFSALREELSLRKEGRGKNSGPTSEQMLTGRDQVGCVCGGCLPCPGHDSVLLGLLEYRATHTSVLQGALPGQLPLLLCRGIWEGSCVLPPGPPYLTAQGSLGWASIGKLFASVSIVAGILILGSAAQWRHDLALYILRQIVRGNRGKLTPVFQELYSHVEQLVCPRCQRKAREGEVEQKAGAVRASYR